MNIFFTFILLFPKTILLYVHNLWLNLRHIKERQNVFADGKTIQRNWLFKLIILRPFFEFKMAAFWHILEFIFTHKCSKLAGALFRSCQPIRVFAINFPLNKTRENTARISISKQIYKCNSLSNVVTRW